MVFDSSIESDFGIHCRIEKGTNFLPSLRLLALVNPRAGKKTNVYIPSELEKSLLRRRTHIYGCADGRVAEMCTRTRYKPLIPSYFQVLVRQSIGPLNLAI